MKMNAVSFGQPEWEYGYLSMLFFIALFAIPGCQIGDDQVNRNLYEFREEVTISPVKATYSVGDIIMLGVNVPIKTFEDIKTGETVSVGNARFTLNSRIEQINIEPIPQDSVLFDFFLQSGEAQESDDSARNGMVSLQYGCPESDYSLQFGYEFKSAGNYLIVLNELNVPSLIIFTSDSDCSLQTIVPPPNDADQAFVQYAFGEADVNLEEFEEGALNQNLPNYSYYKELLENKAAFFVQVR